jgi:hypothetical protein
MRRRAFLALALRPSARLATFEADITPPGGTPLCLGLVMPSVRVDDPLKARGVVLFPERQKPVVLCALDWISVGNTSQDQWKAALARAVDTEPGRVAVHTVHQHDAPGADAAAAEILGADGILQSAAFSSQAIERTAAAARKLQPRRVTHISAGQAAVEQVASNRRILGPDGKVVFVRFTACRNSPHCGAPEGVVDRMMKSIGFWDGGERIASLAYYATHPMSHYGKGAVSADFPGMARDAQEGFCVYFTGAAGNIGAGKYNDGAPEMRRVLADRLADAMRRARAAEEKHALDRIGWSSVPARLPLREGKEYTEEALLAELQNTGLEPKFRANAARYLAWLRLTKGGRTIPITCLRLGPVRLVHLPGEPFVEYQLAAQRERPNEMVAVAGYGDYGPMYIGTAKAYEEGGYETSGVSRVSPGVEEVLLEAQRKALG